MQRVPCSAVHCVQILTLAVCSQASSRNKKLYRYATRRPAEVSAPAVPMLVWHLVRSAQCYAKDQKHKTPQPCRPTLVPGISLQGIA